ncbi:hypothetical protein Ccrd_001616 [Cynara cardunculus var. scolymus]|uniref:Transmembrane protein n=1 Tax=Cynara cardunculus var. scolymus TaxID=59895 RepID=A0A124SDA0_CYNCS|nr:hypothetical protein Ccrd_001616 [Cynara cardunculus var. scolymus]
MATATLISTVSINLRRPATFQPKTPLFFRRRKVVTFDSNSKPWESRKKVLKENSFFCAASRRNSSSNTVTDISVSELDDNIRKVVQLLLWAAEGVYIIWLFLLPYAPGDPVWAISSDTINSLVGLSLNFFFILPLANSVGIRLIDAPVLHPMSEGLFNFVIGWTFMFAPLLFTDPFLIPYMAIRLNKPDAEYTPRKASQLGSVMVNGASVVGVVGGAACLISILWGLFGRSEGDFGSVADRWEFVVSYLGSERLAYAFIWDICLYIVFQPWLIGENLENVEKGKANIVKYLRFVPVFGLVAYLLCLDVDEEV